MHIPGNLPLPASSLLTPARLLSSYLTGWGAFLQACSKFIKADQGEETWGYQRSGDADKKNEI